MPQIFLRHFFRSIDRMMPQFAAALFFGLLTRPAPAQHGQAVCIAHLAPLQQI
jgi:hypothetical protein